MMLTTLLGYCGNGLEAGSVVAPVTDCSMVCAGNPLEYCGNGNRLELYKLTSAPTTAAPSSQGETKSQSVYRTCAGYLTASPSPCHYHQRHQHHRGRPV